MKLRAALAVASALPLLAGCVAAAALPFVAAGGIARSQASASERTADAAPRVALPAEQGATGGSAQPGPIVRDYAFSDGSTVTVTSAVGAAPRAARSAPSDGGSLVAATVLPGMTELPPPSAAPAAARISTGLGSFAEFAAYARAQAAIPAAGAERRSAMLDDSARLAPERRICSIHPAAVLIDLDRSGGSPDEAVALTADPAFAAALAGLRRDGVEIGWVSGRTADRAGEVRRALTASGLDPEGRDELVLLRLPGERKQTRREDFAKSHCVLAIAGDERADFDELFGYLRDPAAASPLDALIGQGWFLVPTPLG